jgi:hypothetical protein
VRSRPREQSGLGVLDTLWSSPMHGRIGTAATIGLAAGCLLGATPAIGDPAPSSLQVRSRQHARAVAASCSRAVKYNGGLLEGGFYRYRDMTCHLARSIVREYLEHGRAPRGFRCSEISPRPSRPGGATLCTAGKPLVEFGSE